MSFIDLLREIPDPRQEGKIKHNLSAILFSTLCGVLCGSETWSDISDFCEAKHEWLSGYVDLSQGVPSEWTYRRVFTLLDPECLEWLLRTHALSIVGSSPRSHIAIDGKALRNSKRHNLKCLHSISALCHESGVTLAERSVDQKSNEITAIPLLLDVLQLQDATITIDAAGCQSAIVEKIIEKKGDYVLALKKNQPKLHEAIQSYMQSHAINKEHCLKDSFDDSHGRCVRRRYFSCDITHIEESKKWKGLQSAIAVETISSQDLSPMVKAEWRYYISSHSPQSSLLPDYVRNHWGIENKVHWVLDVHLKEDNDRKAERRSAKAFAVLRRIALNIVRTKDQNPKRSLRRRFKRAGWDHLYLLNLLL